MGDVVPLPVGPSDRELTQEFVNCYREKIGLEPMVDPVSFREGMGEGVRFYRYRGPGRQFAITGDPKKRDALLAAGAPSFLAFRFSPEADESWDIPLPPYLWEFL